ncbi:MAG: ATPase domain-containing protein [Byssovorax sp.]
MTDVLIESFPITGLEYVFVPPGLPLITKTVDAPATTSILIRGGAGAGKTTLAVALAHAIAREQKGVALYLTTEFVATELTYKAKTLKLPEGSVASWQSPKEHAVGTLLAEHLLRTKAGADVKTVAGRKRAAIDAVWELLARDKDEPSAEMQAGPPVRAVVIDAFGLPEIENDDEALRNELLGLVQTLELAGITTILIEEAGTRGEAWLPFVVDLVFELELWPDPDTGELSRRLKCPKNRYGRAIPGPHDYGMDNDSPSVWPDLISVGGTHTSLINQGNLPPAIFFPTLTENQYVVCSVGTIILSEYDKENPLVAAFLETPGLRVAAVNCGPLTRTRMPDGSLANVPENEGPYALAWLLLRAYRAGKINSVLFQEFEFYLSRPRLRVGALRMLEMVRTAGLSICLNGRAAELAPATSVSQYLLNGKMAAAIRRSLPAHRPCLSVLWLAEMQENARADGSDSLEWSPHLHMIRGTLTPSDILSMVDRAFVSDPNRSGIDALFRYASILHLLGASGRANSLIAQIQPTDRSSVVARIRIYLLMGNDMTAANECISMGNKFPGIYREAWPELSAIYAQNKFAIERLAALTHPQAHSVAALLRALAAGEQFERAAQVVDARAAQFEFPAWFVARLKADAYLEASSSEALQVALKALSLLVADTTIPPVHRAEIFYNLGVARMRLGDDNGAEDAYKQALASNPHLDVAAKALAERKR